jgi:hypothetical protein
LSRLAGGPKPSRPSAPDRPAAPKNVPLDPDTGSVLLYTSGTTDQPKGVRLDTGRLTVQTKTVASHHCFVPDDVGYSSLPPFHVNAQVVGLLTAVTTGAMLALDDRFHAQEFWYVVNAAWPTWINAVPPFWAFWPTGPVGDVTGARFVRSASVPLRLPHLGRRRQRDRDRITARHRLFSRRNERDPVGRGLNACFAGARASGSVVRGYPRRRGPTPLVPGGPRFASLGVRLRSRFDVSLTGCSTTSLRRSLLLRSGRAKLFHLRAGNDAAKIRRDGRRTNQSVGFLDTCQHLGWDSLWKQ